MNAGLALGYFKAIRRVEGSSWEVVGRKGPNPEQHGRVLRVSVSSWEGPRGCWESVGGPCGWSWGDLGGLGDLQARTPSVTLMVLIWWPKTNRESISQGRPEGTALSLPDDRETIPFLLAPQRNGKENGKGENSEQSNYLSKRDFKNSYSELISTLQFRLSCSPSIEMKGSPKSQVRFHF